MHLKEMENAGGSTDVKGGREVLPTNVKPLHYDLTLEPDFERFTFDGQVSIDLDVKQDTDSIQLNSIEIDIRSASVFEQSQKVVDNVKIQQNEEAQVATITFDKKLSAGSKATLVLDFTGKLNDNMAGFYRSSYVDKAGKTRYIASTQMEPTDARRAFPCFDEPALKAQFSITLIADKELVCLSNMDISSEKEVSTKLGSKKKAVSFTKTPPMSTYLVAFVVGALKQIETKAFRVPIRVFATPDKDIEHGRFALDLAAKTLAFYEKEFDSEFPLPKMDMVAVPDFSAGAMENWGLVTYRVVDLLLDEKVAGAMMKQRVAEVVQHELAHQWFGNLVTMDFWDGLWLNEGFATWMSWYSCNRFYPEWKVWEEYVTDTLQGALSLDALRSSHPIEVPVKRADEVNQIFDAISYSKGSCVLVMIAKYVGEETFMEGIRRYIKRHAYGNTKTEDLWAALAEASGKPVEKVMDIWTKNIGYPVVTVKENEDKQSITVKQNRFLSTADVKPEEDKTLYPVFLGLKTKHGVDEDLVLSSREQTFPLASGAGFFKLNADHSNLYRTSYTPEHLAQLGEAAKNGLLSTQDRAGMIADAGALAASGYQKTSGLLSLLDSFDSEKEYVVWSVLISRIYSVSSAWIFESEEVREALDRFQLHLVADKCHEKGWVFEQNDGQIETQFKALLFEAAGAVGDKKVVNAALEMFSKFAAGDKAAINPNIRISVYGIVLKLSASAADKSKAFDTILNEYRTAATANERNDALRGLTKVGSDKALIERTLKLPLSDEVKAQDVYLTLAGLRREKEGVEALWDWMLSNWDGLTKKCPPSLGHFGDIVRICTSGFTSEQWRLRIKEYFGTKSTKGYDRALSQSLDSIQAKSSWLQRDREDVIGWLKQHGYLSGKS